MKLILAPSLLCLILTFFLSIYSVGNNISFKVIKSTIFLFKCGHQFYAHFFFCFFPKFYALVFGKQGVCEVKVAQLCPALCDLMVYTVHGILQARILEWVAFPFSRGSSQPRNRTQVSCIAGGFFIS